MKPRKIPTGTKGTLLRSMGGYCFRVKADNIDGFEDYYLVHNDLDVMITDTFDAYVYELADGTLILDHSPDTLGIKV